MKPATKYRLRAEWFRAVSWFVVALPFIALVVFVWALVTHGMGTAWGAGMGVITGLFSWSALPDFSNERERSLHRYRSLTNKEIYADN